MTILAVAGSGGDASVLTAEAGGIGAVSTSASHFDSAYSSSAFQGGQFNGVWRLQFTSTNDFWTHFRMLQSNFGTADTNPALIFFSNTGPELRFRPKGTLATATTQRWLFEKTLNGTTWTQLGTVEFDLTFAVQNNFDIQINLHASTGYVRVYKNGSIVYSFSGDTSSQTNTVNQISFSGTRTNLELHFSEIIVATDVTIDWRVRTFAPNAVGNYTEWTGAFGDIDEAILDMADTITTNVVNNRLTFNVANTTAAQVAGREIKCVSQSHRGLLTVDSTPLDLKHLVRIGATDYLTADLGHARDGIPRNKQTLHVVSPATSVKWTTAEFDGAEFGVRAV